MNRAVEPDHWLSWPWFEDAHRSLASDLTAWIAHRAEIHADAAAGTGKPARRYMPSSRPVAGSPPPNSPSPQIDRG